MAYRIFKCVSYSCAAVDRISSDLVRGAAMAKLLVYSSHNVDVLQHLRVCVSARIERVFVG